MWTSWPARRRAIAAERPAMPAPAMMTFNMAGKRLGDATSCGESLFVFLTSPGRAAAPQKYLAPGLNRARLIDVGDLRRLMGNGTTNWQQLWNRSYVT